MKSVSYVYVKAMYAQQKSCAVTIYTL